MGCELRAVAATHDLEPAWVKVEEIKLILVSATLDPEFAVALAEEYSDKQLKLLPGGATRGCPIVGLTPTDLTAPTTVGKPGEKLLPHAVTY